LFDNNSIEQWIADGSQEVTQRALTEAKALLEAYQEPRREREIPAVEALNTEH